MLNKYKCKFKLVFLACCHSKYIGEIFFKSGGGAEHVICVARDAKIQNEICQHFARAFYQAFFLGNHTICESFHIA